jgi:hypothetical protein
MTPCTMNPTLLSLVVLNDGSRASSPDIIIAPRVR